VLFYTYDIRNAFGQNTVPKTFCCSTEMEAAKQCVRGDVVLRKMEGIEAPFGIRKVAFSSQEPTAHVNFRYDNVQNTSTYYVVISNCLDSSGVSKSGALVVDGEIQWRNPFGWLPGSSVGIWYYYGLQALAYLFTSLTFAALMFLYRTQLLRIQYGILLLFFLGMLQTFCWFIYELKRNQTGQQSSATGALVMSIIFTVLKGSVTRLVVLAVCMGIGIIKWTFGSLKVPILGITGAYTLASLFYEVVENVKATSSTTPNSFLMAIVLFAVAVCDSIFVWWSLVSLIRTMGQLTLRRQTIKLTMYKRFFYVMVGVVAVWVLSLIIHFFVLATKSIEQIWRSNWLWLAFWHFSFFVIITIVAFLWRPTRNNTRYGYSEVYYDEEEGDDIGAPADNEVQLHAMGSTSPVGETRTRSVMMESGDSDSELSFSSKFDTYGP
jgi:hypothetical protein